MEVQVEVLKTQLEESRNEVDRLSDPKGEDEVTRGLNSKVEEMVKTISTMTAELDAQKTERKRLEGEVEMLRGEIDVRRGMEKNCQEMALTVEDFVRRNLVR